MPLEITMPQLSDTMTAGTIVKWLKNEGDKVRAGEIIAEIETDKATMEMESFESGTLAVIVAREGQQAEVGKAIAILATGAEKVEDVRKGSSAAATSATSSPAAAKAAPAAADASAAPPAAPKPAATAGTAVAAPAGNGAEERVRVSPLAKRIAAEKGIDLRRVQGSGPGGRIVQKDVLEFADPGAKPSAPASKPAPAAALPQRLASGEKKVVALSKLRQVIAQRLQQSKQQLPHFYETVDVDVEALVGFRERLNRQLEKSGVRISLGDIVTRAVASALLRHPVLNAHFAADKAETTQFADVHLGMAVALDGGLIVPVLRSVQQMGLVEIRTRSADLVERARAQKLRQDELSGATFTVSNLGMYGIREFSAIINPPEVGILAVGAAEPRAVVRDGQVVARTVMTLTLSADHRVVDGAAAAEFLRSLRGMLEDPAMMLV